MATFLFWNLNKKPLLCQIATLCHEHKVDVFILAESGLSTVELLEALNGGQRAQFRVPSFSLPSLPSTIPETRLWQHKIYGVSCPK